MSFYRYVCLDDIPDYELHGWRIACPASVWSVLMRYVGGGAESS